MQHAIRVTLAAALLALMQMLDPIAAMAQDNVWRVSKVSGEAWIAGSGVQQASLGSAAELKPGDTIRTGRNGRILLVRGAETMLISANTQVGVPTTSDSGRSTILQQAGSILLDVEKRNVQHFEVETPFLAAVVKGTQFRVTVTAAGAKVDVNRGQVEVADFRSGQSALVQPGQAASVTASGATGLNLSGAGRFGAIRQGAPRTPSVRPVAVPRGGLSQPSASGQQVRRIGGGEGTGRAVSVSSRTVRVGTALGEVNVDVNAVTKGLSRGTGSAGAAAAGRGQATVWATGELSPGSGASANARRASDAATGRSDSATAIVNTNAQANGHARGVGASGNEGSGKAKPIIGNGGGNGNAGGNGNGNGNANANAGRNGNANANANAGGNGNGNANANAGRNGNANANASAGGNGTANANANAGGNGNGNANANARGNGNGNVNVNAGGNGSGRR